MTDPIAEALFDAIRGFISDSRALLETDELETLAGLDGRVQELCDAVLGLSDHQRSTYADKLELLFSELSVLAASLVKRRDEVAGELRSSSNHRKASVAYTSVNATGPAAMPHGTTRKTDGSDEG